MAAQAGHAETAILIAGLLGALLAALIHGLTDYFLDYPRYYFFVWMLVGALAALATKHDS